LAHYTQEIYSSNFEPAVIKRILIESYHAYYHLYNDILLPYYLSLLLILAASQNQPCE
jgi:hypothetical protein